MSTYREIFLEKIAKGPCDSEPTPPAWRRPRCASMGMIFRYTYVSSTSGEALLRAAKALVREYPGEDRMSWKVVHDEAAAVPWSPTVYAMTYDEAAGQ